MTDAFMTKDDIESIVSYCAEEVHRQGRTPHQVSYMVDAWLDAVQEFPNKKYPSLEDIQAWGTTIEPESNPYVDGLGYWNSFRAVQVFVGDHVPVRPEFVYIAMEDWYNRLPELSPEQAYREFEEIHPFVDGNGRVGKIIFNWLNGSLLSPEWPPNFWGIFNP